MTAPRPAILLPPYAAFLGLDVIADADGPLVRMPFAALHAGRPGFLHGGAIAGLLEIAALVALAEAMPGGSGTARAKPINTAIDFTRGGREVTSFARGMVTRLGSRVADVTATAWQDDPARPIAGARMHYLLRVEE